MPAVPSRELSITYGAVTYSPDGQYRVTEAFDSFTLVFDFLVAPAAGTTWTDAQFKSACSTARAAFRKPFQDLTIAQGAQTLYSIAPSANTGLETRPEIVKEEHVANTGRSRRFTVRITCGLPADNVTTPGLREFSVNVAYSAARRRLVTISGVWTAIEGTAARAKYEAGIATLCESVRTGLSITTWELIAEDPTTSSYNDKTISWSRSYHEIKFGQAGGTDDSAIVEQRLTVAATRRADRNAPGGLSLPLPSRTSGAPSASSLGPALPFTLLDARFECWVDFSVSTDLKATWTRIRSWVLAQLRATQDGGAFAVVSETPSYMPDDNRISVAVQAIAVPAGVSVVRREFAREVTKTDGWNLPAAWTGNKLSKYAYEGPQTFRSTTTMLEEAVTGGGAQVGGGSSAGAAWGGLDGAFGSLESSPGSGGAGIDPIGGGLESVVLSDVTTEEPFDWGIESPIRVTRTKRVRILEYFAPIQPPVNYGART